jgi:hypothetical protein
MYSLFTNDQQDNDYRVDFGKDNNQLNNLFYHNFKKSQPDLISLAKISGDGRNQPFNLSFLPPFANASFFDICPEQAQIRGYEQHKENR